MKKNNKKLILSVIAVGLLTFQSNNGSRSLLGKETESNVENGLSIQDCKSTDSRTSTDAYEVTLFVYDSDGGIITKVGMNSWAKIDPNMHPQSKWAYDAALWWYDRCLTSYPESKKPNLTQEPKKEFFFKNNSKVYNYKIKNNSQVQEFKIYTDVVCAGTSSIKKTNYSYTKILRAGKSHSFTAQVDPNHSISFIGLANYSKPKI
jgi:hypothetical protein